MTGNLYLFGKSTPFYGFGRIISFYKGQLTLKCPFGVFKSSKKPTKFFPGFLPKPLKRGQIKKIRALYTTNWRILF